MSPKDRWKAVSSIYRSAERCGFIAVETHIFEFVMVGDTELMAGLALLQAQLATMPNGWSDEHIEMTASRLENLHYTPPVPTPIGKFLRLRNSGMQKELAGIAAMPEPDEQSQAAANWRETRLGHMQVLMFYYKKLLALRAGDGEAWDEVDELYVHD